MQYKSGIWKIYYRPLEAAIRWVAIDDEQKILKSVGGDLRPDLNRLSRWPAVYFYNELIHDAIINKELPCGKNGVTCEVSPDDPDLTVRRIDLIRWASKNYPFDKPGFLFSEEERGISTGIDIRALLTLLINNHLLKESVSYQNQTIKNLERQCTSLKENPGELKERSENTYLSIIGAMLDILVKDSPCELSNQEAIIDALLTHFPGRPGLSERTLRSKFAAARRVITTNYL